MALHTNLPIYKVAYDLLDVAIVYRNVPDADPVTTMLLKSILRAMDEWHSLTSKAKGLAGMAENVRQGWRAGGRAPRGYTLEYVATGAVRDGQPVTKSRLLPCEDADLVAEYLQARAAGEMRGQIIARLGVDWPTASLNGMEWQALTYAGHTVWNMHAERTGSSSTTGERRRPRAEWLMQRDTHPALITETEAEAILQQLETQRATHRRRDADQYLLTGLMRTPDGQAWAGDAGGYYRVGKGKRIAARRVDESVLARIFGDMADDDMAEMIARSVRDMVAEPVDGRAITGLERKLASMATQIGRTVDMAARMDNPDPVLRRVADLEAERAGVIDRLADLRRRQAQAETAATVDASDVRVLLRAFRSDLEKENAPEVIRRILADLVELIELDPVSLDCRICYRLSGVNLASRRGSELSPVRWAAPVAVLPKRRMA